MQKPGWASQRGCSFSRGSNSEFLVSNVEIVVSDCEEVLSQSSDTPVKHPYEDRMPDGRLEEDPVENFLWRDWLQHARNMADHRAAEETHTWKPATLEVAARRSAQSRRRQYKGGQCRCGYAYRPHCYSSGQLTVQSAAVIFKRRACG